MQSGYLHLDWAGDSGTGEEAIMALDYYTYTLDPSYLHIAFAAGDFLMQVGYRRVTSSDIGFSFLEDGRIGEPHTVSESFTTLSC